MWIKRRITIITTTLCCIILFLSNSIPATNNYIMENPTVNKNDIIQENIQWNKIHPQYSILFNIIIKLLTFRFNRGQILYDFATSTGAFNWLTIDYPLLFYRALWLIISAEFLLSLFEPVHLPCLLQNL